MRVLISAYACEPSKGSEPGVGWNWVRQIARFADEVWVITRANNRPVIEEALKKEPLPNVHWVYFDLPCWARFWKKGQRGVHLYYYLWQIGIYFLSRRLYREVRFDLVHHVTFVNYWMPGFLALLPVPFVWGPVGGGESAPKSFYSSFSLWGRIYEWMREFVRWFGELDPFTKMTARRSTVALATTWETADRLMRLGARCVSVLSQVALPEEEIVQLSGIPLHQGNPFRLLSLGRLLHWKGFHLGLMAFARFVREFPQSEYWLVGDGPERRNLERLVGDLGIADKVRFWGALPRAQALKKLAECNVLLHPSLHHSGGLGLRGGHGRRAASDLFGFGWSRPAGDRGGRLQDSGPHAGTGGGGNGRGDVEVGHADKTPRRWMSEAARRRVREEYNWSSKAAMLRRVLQEEINVQS